MDLFKQFSLVKLSNATKKKHLMLANRTAGIKIIADLFQTKQNCVQLHGNVLIHFPILTWHCSFGLPMITILAKFSHLEEWK